jgi:hypothetical protein
VWIGNAQLDRLSGRRYKKQSIEPGCLRPFATPTGTAYIDFAITNGVTYYYVVRAVNTSGSSGNSSEVSATPGGP